MLSDDVLNTFRTHLSASLLTAIELAVCEDLKERGVPQSEAGMQFKILAEHSEVGLPHHLNLAFLKGINRYIKWLNLMGDVPKPPGGQPVPDDHWYLERLRRGE